MSTFSRQSRIFDPVSREFFGSSSKSTVNRAHYNTEVCFPVKATSFLFATAVPREAFWTTPSLTQPANVGYSLGGGV